MIRKILLFVIILTQYISYGKYEVRVNLYDNLCPFCYSYISYLNDLPDNIELVFEVNKDNKRMWNSKLKNYNITSNYTIIERKGSEYSDALYVDFLHDGEVIFNTTLENLPSFYNTINTIVNDLTVNDSISLQDFILSSRIELDVVESRIIIYDMLMNSLNIFNADNKKFNVIAGAELSTSSLIEASDIDTSFYNDNLSMLKKINMDKVTIHSGCVNEDTIFLLLSVKYPKEFNGSLAIAAQFFLCKYFDHSIVDVKLMKELGIQDDSKAYGLAEKLFYDGNTFITNVFSVEQEGENYGLCRWTINNNKLNSSIIDFKFPSFKKTENPFLYSAMGLKRDFLFFNYYPVIYYPETDSVLDYSRVFNEPQFFEESIEISKTPVTIIDIDPVDNCYSWILYKKDKIYYLAMVDFDKQEIVSQKEIIIQKEIIGSSLKLMPDNKIVAISKDRSKMYFFE